MASEQNIALERRSIASVAGRSLPGKTIATQQPSCTPAISLGERK